MSRFLHVSLSFFLLALFAVWLHSVNTQPNWLQLGGYFYSFNTTDWDRWVHHCSDGSRVPRAEGANDHTCNHERQAFQACQAVWWEGRYIFWTFGALYIPVWKGIQVYMRDKKPLGDTSQGFKTGFFLWNLMLGYVSICCFINFVGIALWHRSNWMRSDRQSRQFVFCYQSEHIYGSGSIEVDDGPEGYAQKQRLTWLMIFGLFKVVEMFDTVWLVLNKKEVLTLQWWHHLTVMLYCWLVGISYPDSGDGILFALVNAFIHSLMYPYFAFAVMFPCVRSFYIRFSLTVLQITQMFIGLGLRFYYDSYCTPIYPEYQYWVGKAGELMYGSYAVLFIKFFLDEYYWKTTKMGLVVPSVKKGQ